MLDRHFDLGQARHLLQWPSSALKFGVCLCIRRCLAAALLCEIPGTCDFVNVHPNTVSLVRGLVQGCVSLRVGRHGLG